MSTTILFSTFLLTVLLAIGLFFFIRASVKDRTEVIQLISKEPTDSLLAQLQQYFTQRSYQVVALDAEQNQVTFAGFVRPSWFLAIFLTFLAALGILCLVLVLAFLFPQKGLVFLGLELLSPIAGIFYWQKAGRQEQVSLKLESKTAESTQETQNLITVTGHRDELSVLRETLGLQQAS
ncbi:cofactor assembly of complex C subunit B [Aerosakkonemataceae cyanobacterium BLCC-F154]|uniref:Cofactor assembly of complex C subunit B n=1 Tax=Floridaenema fluviatile BLCC-F154 TaxID=3153640 RepID=A0ABV4YEH1_9CYAN